MILNDNFPFANFMILNDNWIGSVWFLLKITSKNLYDVVLGAQPL